MNKNYIKITETTLNILNNKLWHSVSLKEIKKKSQVKSFDKLINNKQELLKKINHYFDYELSLVAVNIEKSNKKDMMFEILMMRFDILQANRKGIISIFDSFKQRPKELFFLLPDLLNSILLMMNYAKFSSTGILGQLKTKGLFIIYISSFLVWLKDDTRSLEKTMISVDNYLDQADKILNFSKKYE